MLTMSKPISAGQARRYHAEEFRSTRDNYYSEGDQIVGRWHGQLAARWSLNGEVGEEQFARLADGQHPATGEQLIRHQTPHKSTNARGESITTMEHRAGWDATFSAPKSVSITALVGGDERIRDAHRESVAVALDELERYAQARLGGDRPAETTGQWIAATFEHDSARPVDGYAAPQVHTHAVIFNLTETGNGDVRALQPRELYRTQQYATVVYRSELAIRLEALGYEVERGKSGQPEIVGYTPEYLDASSPRRQQIEDYLARADQRGAAAAQIAAHQTRDTKRDLSPAEVLKQHRQMAEEFGHQPERVVSAAEVRAHHGHVETATTSARAAVAFAKERTFEREAVVDERDLLRDALTRSMGDRTLAEIKTEFEHRAQAGELVPIEQRPDAPGRTFTTPEMQYLEHDTIAMMQSGQNSQGPIAKPETAVAVEHDHTQLSVSQRVALHQVLNNRDQVVALEGVAGAGKTTTLAAVRDAAEREGYVVEGFAPTSRAAHQLAEAGIPSRTLQRHLSHTDEGREPRSHLYILDESSLASTKQMNAFLHRLQTNDRVLLVGDVRQHEAVEAGSPYRQLQEAGVTTARLDDIIRQKDPGLKTAVESLSRGDVRAAIAHLEGQGRVHEVPHPEERLRTISDAYAREPERTLVISPDNQSRAELNRMIHGAMQARGHVDQQEHQARVLVPRQDIIGADRQWAGRYERGDVVRYSKGSQTHDIRAGDYARVERVDVPNNRLIVAREDGGHLSYDPRRLQGVTVYREAERALSAGDRVQFTAPDRSLSVANRELGTIEGLDAEGHARVRLDSGRTVSFAIRDHPHLDHGYAVTSHSSQGQTADRVLVHVDSDRGAELVNRRFAYVAVSRARHDAHIYTNDRSRLPEALSRDGSHRSAIAKGQAQSEAPAHANTASAARTAADTARTRTSAGHDLGFSR